jgi:hypothetical protein
LAVGQMATPEMPFRTVFPHRREDLGFCVRLKWVWLMVRKIGKIKRFREVIH